MGDKLILVPMNDGTGRYYLYDDFKDIPTGFITDGGSIPRFFWRFIGHPFESEYIEVYVEHDHDYAVGKISRKEADEKLLAGLKAKGMGYGKRYAIYWAVRIFAGSYYNNENNKEKIKMNRLYGKIVDDKFIAAPMERIELPDGRGYCIKYISDEALASGEYKEVLTRGVPAPNADAMVRTGRVAVSYEETDNFIIRTYVMVTPVDK